MNIQNYLERIKEEKRGKNDTISSVIISNRYYSDYNIKLEIGEIRKVLKEEQDFFEITYGTFIFKNVFYNFIKKLSLEELKDSLEMEYFLEITDVDMERVKKFLNSPDEILEETISEETLEIVKGDLKESSEKKVEILELDLLSEKIEKLNEGIKKIEPFLEKKLFWNFSVEEILGSDKKTLKEIGKEFLFFNRRDYEDILEEVLADKNCFKIVDLKGSYSKKENFKFLELENSLSYELKFFLEELKGSYEVVFREKIMGGKTLQQLGDEIGLTRERIRQMEVKLRERLNTRKMRLTFTPYFEYITNFFQRKENLIVEKTLFEDYIFLKEEEFGDLEFDLIRIYNEFNEDGLKINSLYDKYLSLLTKEEIDKIFTDTFEKEKFIPQNEVLESLERAGVSSEEFMKTYLENSDYFIVKKDFVLYKNSKIIIGDKMEFVFRTLDRELKISELVELMKEYFDETYTDHNINGKLLSDEKIFRRIFSGTYSLTEWGMNKHINSRDLIVEFLREKGEPLHYSEICEGIRDKTFVNENTIKVFIGSSEETFNYSHGFVALKEWVKDKEKREKFFISENRIEASLNSVVNDNYKGTFEKNGKIINLHRMAKAYIENGGSVDTGRKMFSSEKQGVKTIFTLEKRYYVRLSPDRRGISGMKSILNDKNLEIGDYFYLENNKNGTLNLYTWKEFEEGMRREEEHNIPLPEQEENSPVKVEEEGSNSEELELKVGSFQDILEYGLKNGFIYLTWLEKLEEKGLIDDYFEAVEEIEGREIKIIY